MSLSIPEVHIVADPAKAEPTAGAFMRIVLRDEVTRWSAQVLKKVNGALESDNRFPCNFGIGSAGLILYLRRWVQSDVGEKYIFMTEQAAKILLPAMAVPVVEFTLAVPTTEPL